MSELHKRLDSGLAALALELDETTRERLIDYVGLLVKWNKAYNLTAVREPLQMMTRHILDSLAVVPHIQEQRMIDVGTGPGLPGIPLAIVFPEREFVLLDSNGKKTRFLNQARAELGLANVTVVNSRVEAYHPERDFPAVITRAFAALADILISSSHLLEQNGRVLAMKGVLNQQELDAVPAGFKVMEIIPLQVPGLEQEQRHLVCIGRNGA